MPRRRTTVLTSLLLVVLCFGDWRKSLLVGFCSLLGVLRIHLLVSLVEVLVVAAAVLLLPSRGLGLFNCRLLEQTLLLRGLVALVVIEVPQEHVQVGRLSRLLHNAVQDLYRSYLLLERASLTGHNIVLHRGSSEKLLDSCQLLLLLLQSQHA